ncbi:hypothetical protein SAMN02745673_03309 [Marinactinospora thermotolerans DSM 45154]|uniref:Uncharacterized protein n=1 Tax=Marinactinospora thermotolerans DSM 45154 TaxID=1122192 RepID=A0A1T4SC68_9ACTN|nr:hypothetical protein [Marinactinospora thermotolerans]SKA25471.1 hypothetical protein SAMN02745673_03309 [Marinactinospora thermotolerans DSM 45154]
MRRPCLPGHAVARDLSRRSGVLVWHGETSRGYLALVGHELLIAATPEEMWMRLAARGLIPTREESSPRSMVLPGRDHLAGADTTNTTWTQVRAVRPAGPVSWGRPASA